MGYWLVDAVPSSYVKREVDAVEQVDSQLRNPGFLGISEQCLNNILHENWKKVLKV